MGIIDLKLKNHPVTDLIKLKYYRALFSIFQRASFHCAGKKVAIIKPVRVLGKKNISLMDDITIRDGAFLSVNNRKVDFPCLQIDYGVNIGHFAHIVANHNVCIKSNVLIADKVFISDCTHVYDDISCPIIKQGIQNINSVVIGEGSWIGENVAILGVKIGKHCIIGANSVVTKNVPDYSIAAGNPAKVIKQYDVNTKEWISI